MTKILLQDQHGICDSLRNLGFRVIGLAVPGDGAYRIEVHANPGTVVPVIRASQTHLELFQLLEAAYRLLEAHKDEAPWYTDDFARALEHTIRKVREDIGLDGDGNGQALPGRAPA